jgi:ATP-binding cassette subfamily B protein
MLQRLTLTSLKILYFMINWSVPASKLPGVPYCYRQIMSQVQDIITMVFLATGLMAFNPWLIVLLLIAIIPAFLGESYFNDQSYLLTRGQTPERRELDYLRYLGSQRSDGQGDQDHLICRTLLLIAFNNYQIAFITTANAWQSNAHYGVPFLLCLGSIGYYGAYVFIIIRTVEGKVTIGALAFLAGSFRQLRGLLEGILTRFSTVSQGAIYLRDFFEFFDIQPRS